MPRSPRYNFPGAIHHVMLRGNQGRQIFYSDADRVKFCLLIQEGVERFRHRIHAFCLMHNHVHLAWQEGEQSLSPAIQNLAFRYAQRVNRIRKEVGHVFQGRFKSVLVNKEGYLTRLVRYIHLNPVRAGIVDSPEAYKWSGHNSYLGTDPIVWVEREYVLRRYSNDRSKAIQRYNDFIYSGINVKPEIDFKQGVQSGIIGDELYIQQILENSNLETRKLDLSISDLIKEICSRYEVSKVEIISHDKKRNLANVRAVLALLARDLKGFSIVELAKILNRDPSGLSRLAAKLDRKLKNSPIEMRKFKTLTGELYFQDRSDSI